MDHHPGEQSSLGERGGQPNGAALGLAAAPEHLRREVPTALDRPARLKRFYFDHDEPGIVH